MTEGQFRHTLSNIRNWNIAALGVTPQCAAFLRRAARDVRRREAAERIWPQHATEDWARACRVLSFQDGRLVIEAGNSIAAFELQRCKARLKASLQGGLPGLLEIVVEHAAASEQDEYERDDQSGRDAGGYAHG